MLDGVSVIEDCLNQAGHLIATFPAINEFGFNLPASEGSSTSARSAVPRRGSISSSSTI